MVVIQSKKDVAFKLFAQGKTALSPEIKALKLKGKTRYNYYLEWKQIHGIKDEEETADESKRKKIPSELTMLRPAEEREEGEEPVESEDEPEETPPKDEEKSKTSGDGKKPPPRMIAGQGLTFSITISTKTLMLYQIAAASQEEELTIGDFLDACVEDTYQGRGLDLGLVKTGGNNG